MEQAHRLVHQRVTGTKKSHGVSWRWLFSLLAIACWPLPHSFVFSARAQSSSANGKQSDPSKQFVEFQERVGAYAKLRNDLRHGIPPVHRKDTPEQIEKHQQQLAARIQEARKNAQVGDLFTP